MEGSKINFMLVDIVDIFSKITAGFSWFIMVETNIAYLVGGLEHLLFSHILGIIIPVD